MTTSTTDRPTAARSSTSDSGTWGSNGKKSNTSRLRGGGRRRSVPHLLVGALLVIACAATFVVVSVNSDDRQTVLALARPVAIGHVLTPQDLRQVNIAVDTGVSTVSAGQATSVVGKTASESLPAGALLTPQAIGSPVIPSAGQAIASLSLKPGQFPQEVSPGAHVSVVFAPSRRDGSASGSSTSSDAQPTWPAVVTSMTSPPNTQTTVVSVQLSQTAARQVAAVPAGQLSLVMLPGGGH